MKNFLVSFLLLILLATPAIAQEELMEPTQLRMLITDVLTEIGLYSEDACELLMLTAAQESHLGYYIKQVGGGPACGIFQIEPTTEQDMYTNFLKYKPELHKRVRVLVGEADWNNMQLIGNLVYQIGVARIKYYRDSKAIPSKDNLEALAKYYKRVWNTHLGKATWQEAVENYRRYVLDKE